LHEIEGDKQAYSGRATWRDSDEDDGSGHVDYGESNHGKQGLIPLGNDESGISPRTTLKEATYAMVM
jgi:hypothetical protein